MNLWKTQISVKMCFFRRYNFVLFEKKLRRKPIRRVGNAKVSEKKYKFFYFLPIVTRVYLTNGDEKIYQMTGWQECAEKLAALVDGAIYKFTGLKALNLNFGDSDIGFVH